MTGLGEIEAALGRIATHGSTRGPSWVALPLSSHGCNRGTAGMSEQYIGLITLLVAGYDEAIRFYVDVLGFHLVADQVQGDGKRWVVVAPPHAADRAGHAALLLAKATTPEQRARVGDQTGGRVMLFLNTEDFDADHTRMLAAGVQFLEAPRTEPYGKVAVFQDLYGNRWDLLQLKTEA